MNNTQNLLRKFAVPLVIIVVLLVGFLVMQSLRFRLVSTNPSTSSVSNISPFIKLNFSKQLRNDSVVLPTNPDVMSSFSVKDKTITVILKQMYVGKSYTIHLDSVESTDGKKLGNINIRFTAKDISFENLPEDQQQAILKNQDKAPKASGDPIFKYIPYSTLSYSITGLVRQPSDTNKSGLYVHIDIYLSNAELSGDAQSTINTYEQQAMDYLKSKGIDPAKYSIEYNVVTQGDAEQD